MDKLLVLKYEPLVNPNDIVAKGAFQKQCKNFTETIKKSKASMKLKRIKEQKSIENRKQKFDFSLTNFTR